MFLIKLFFVVLIFQNYLFCFDKKIFNEENIFVLIFNESDQIKLIEFDLDKLKFCNFPNNSLQYNSIDELNAKIIDKQQEDEIGKNGLHLGIFCIESTKECQPGNEIYQHCGFNFSEKNEWNPDKLVCLFLLSKTIKDIKGCILSKKKLQEIFNDEISFEDEQIDHEMEEFTRNFDLSIKRSEVKLTALDKFRIAIQIGIRYVKLKFEKIFG